MYIFSPSWLSNGELIKSLAIEMRASECSGLCSSVTILSGLFRLTSNRASAGSAWSFWCSKCPARTSSSASSSSSCSYSTSMSFSTCSRTRYSERRRSFTLNFGREEQTLVRQLENDLIKGLFKHYISTIFNILILPPPHCISEVSRPPPQTLLMLYLIAQCVFGYFLKVYIWCFSWLFVFPLFKVP